MAKNGMSKFMDFLKLTDEEDDYEDDDLFDEEDDYYESPKRNVKTKPSRASYYDDEDDYDDEEYDSRRQKSRAPKLTSPSKLVSINSRNNNRSNNQVFVIKPQEFNEAQRVTDYLNEGKTVVVNMEGIEVNAAQRIIDFIGGACYAIDGSLQAISANIFIAAPHSTSVSGDLRDEILNETTFSPDLTMF